MRGQVFELEGKKIFTFGGAASHDIEGGVLDKDDPDYELKELLLYKEGRNYRINHESWWEQELPSKEEMEKDRKQIVKEILTEKQINRVFADIPGDAG